MTRNLSIISLLTLGVLIFTPLDVYATSASLAPASGSYEVNSSFTVSLYENSDVTTIDTVQATLTYDQAALQFVSLSTAGSPFSTCLQTTGGSGSVNITCASLDATKPTGNQFVGSVTFKSLAGNGTTVVPASVLLLSAGTAVANIATQGSYTLTTAPIVTATENSVPATTQRTTTVATDDNSAAESTVTAETTEQTLAVTDTTVVAAETDDTSNINWGFVWLVSALATVIIAALVIWRKAVIAKTTPIIKRLKTLVSTK